MNDEYNKKITNFNMKGKNVVRDVCEKNKMYPEKEKILK